MTLITGAGVFAAIGAPFVLIWLLTARPNQIGLIRVAAALSIVAPLLFMLLTIGIYILPNAGSVAFFDYSVNHRAALDLYGQGVSPYNVSGSYSFPFPTYAIYAALSGVGALPEGWSWVTFWIVNALIWIASAILLLRSLPVPQSERERWLRWYAVTAVPAVTVLWQGQTALFILFGLVLLHAALVHPQPRLSMWIGGFGLAFAALIKPQLSLIGVGLLIAALASPDQRRALLNILLAAAILGLSALVLTVVIPGGVGIETYQEFLTSAIGNVAQPADGLIIGSPGYLAAWIAYQVGWPSGDLLASAVTALIVLIAAVHTWHRVRSGSPGWHIAALWGVWAMVAPRVAWTWYAAWCLPFFCLELSRPTASRGRLALIVICMALLAIQPQSLLIAALTIALLIGLAVTSQPK